MKAWIVLGLLIGGSAQAAPECAGMGFPGESAPEVVESFVFAERVHELRDPESGQSVCAVDVDLRNQSEPYQNCKGFGVQAVSCEKFRGKLVDGTVKYCFRVSKPERATLPTCRFNILSFEPRDHQW